MGTSLSARSRPVQRHHPAHRLARPVPPAASPEATPWPRRSSPNPRRAVASAPAGGYTPRTGDLATGHQEAASGRLRERHLSGRQAQAAINSDISQLELLLAPAGEPPDPSVTASRTPWPNRVRARRDPRPNGRLRCRTLRDDENRRAYVSRHLLGGMERLHRLAFWWTDRPGPRGDGFSDSVETVVDALTAAGVGPTTSAGGGHHVHLDHAAGLGDVARAFPERDRRRSREGPPLADPSRLIDRRLGSTALLDDLMVGCARSCGRVLPRPTVWPRSGGGRRLRLKIARHAKHPRLSSTKFGPFLVGDAVGYSSRDRRPPPAPHPTSIWSNRCEPPRFRDLHPAGSC